MELIFLGVVTLAVVGTIFWIWALIDIAKTPADDFRYENDKLVWLLIVIFASSLGALIYLFVGRKQRKFLY
ncbi:PLD nuclease N-terminal domain-containing protein [Proteinivorax hydrogeniformans]|uniref:PLD nuclease N-terminal domain-containing protein n=1 Tax=Proteinivorax hydrogeniformans TaxID=1826727 RepID=A0AAU8HU86_9FIRM